MTNTEKLISARRELIAVFNAVDDGHLKDLLLLALEAIQRAEARTRAIAEKNND